ncbi:MAG: sulfite exporter TauE/SafE family protein [Sedimentisphaerales bacterium]|nr:sulfite exporter TauE/SafE family protein [Sedimentisphaerales bacterium]
MFNEFISTWIPYLLTGLLAGIIGATLGLGGGTIMVPILALVFGFNQKSAQGMSLVVMIPMALMAVFRYKMNPEIDVDLKIAVVLALGAVFGAVIGAAIAGWLPGHLLRKIFAVMMILVALEMWFSGPPDITESVKNRSAPSKDNSESGHVSKSMTISAIKPGY